MAIQFQDLSTGPIGWWEWDFGDGDVSNEQNPLHQFPAPGWYWVCLTVSSPVKECNDIICIRIQVPQPTNCASTFTWTQSAVFPFTIDFTALPGPDADSLMWDFGDGITATGMNPQHTYADTGSFVVTLTATSYHNTVSCWSVYTDTVKVYIDPCISSFMAIPNPTNPLEVSFISSASGSVNSHFWNFGDGRTSFEINPVYTYSDTGTFYVCLTVSNFYYPQYCDDTSCQDVKIQITRCEADFISLQDTIYPLKFQFLNNSAGMLNAFNWDFGDGHSSTETNPLHSFPSPGDYQVQLIVQNTQYPELCGDTTNQVISISSLDCSASFSYLNDSLRPLDFKFFSQITGIPDHIEWNFGDGTTS